MQRNQLALLSSLVFLSALAVSPQVATAKDFHVYYLGGQSNMDGYGMVSELPAELKEGVPDVWIFHGNTAEDSVAADGRGFWTPLKAGHGRSFRSDGRKNTYSDRFGAELTFARDLKKRYPDRNIAIVKYSRGGTSISASASAATRFGCWDPDWQGGKGEHRSVNQYDHFQATLKHARADKDIDNDGEEDRWIPAGIVWMQGESDAMEPGVAKQYQANLTELMGLISRDLGSEDVRVVIGRITDWDVWVHGETVRAAQAAFVKNHDNAALVTSTDGYGNSDPWHYDTAGYLDLGSQFAKAMIGR